MLRVEHVTQSAEPPTLHPPEEEKKASRYDRRFTVEAEAILGQ